VNFYKQENNFDCKATFVWYFTVVDFGYFALQLFALTVICNYSAFNLLGYTRYNIVTIPYII